MSDNAKAAVKWYRDNRRVALLWSLSGIPLGVVSGLLTALLWYPDALLGAMLTGLVFGAVFSYVLNSLNRKP